MQNKNAEDLQSGDVFVYLERNYVSLSNFTDARHTHTITTAVAEEDMKDSPHKITVFRFFRTSKLNVVGKETIILEAILFPECGITKADQKQLDKKLDR